MLYSLWKKKTKQFVSDEFIVFLTEFGMPPPEDISLMGKLNTLFVDLTKDDFDDELFLVCRIYR